MKKSLILLIGLLVAMTLILSACVPGPRVAGTPGVDVSADMVYFAYGQFVFGMNAETGNVAWQFPSNGNNQVLFYAQPFVSGDYVYVGDVAKNFYKINRQTGMAVWTFSEARNYFIGQANEDAGTIYAPANDGFLYAIDADGNLKWAFETGHFIWAQPQIGTNAIFVASMDRFVYALTKTGEEIWSMEMEGAVVGSPILSEDGTRLFVGSIGKDFTAFDTSNGRLVWSFTAEDSIWGRGVLAEGTLYVADSGGSLYALDPGTGNLLWQQAIPGSIIGGLTALDDGIALATEEGMIRALNFDGSPKWERGLSGNIFQAPVVNDQYLVVPVMDGDNLVYAYDLAGTQLWSATPEK
jgi:outer membrane protein assembly factor BamB